VQSRAGQGFLRGERSAPRPDHLARLVRRKCANRVAAVDLAGLLWERRSWMPPLTRTGRASCCWSSVKRKIGLVGEGRNYGGPRVDLES